MNEEIEYAEMLEIPVSTINVIRKRKKSRRADAENLKERAISLVNETANLTEGEPLDADALPYFSEMLENNETDYASQKGREEVARFMPKISRIQENGSDIMPLMLNVTRIILFLNPYKELTAKKFQKKKL